MNTVANIPSVLFLIILVLAFFLPKPAKRIAVVLSIVFFVIGAILVQQDILYVSIVTGPGIE